MLEYVGGTRESSEKSSAFSLLATNGKKVVLSPRMRTPTRADSIYYRHVWPPGRRLGWGAAPSSGSDHAPLTRPADRPALAAVVSPDIRPRDPRSRDPPVRETCALYVDACLSRAKLTEDAPGSPHDRRHAVRDARRSRCVSSCALRPARTTRRVRAGPLCPCSGSGRRPAGRSVRPPRLDVPGSNPGQRWRAQRDRRVRSARRASRPPKAPDGRACVDGRSGRTGRPRWGTLDRGRSARARLRCGRTARPDPRRCSAEAVRFNRASLALRSNGRASSRNVCERTRSRKHAVNAAMRSGYMAGMSGRKGRNA